MATIIENFELNRDWNQRKPEATIKVETNPICEQHRGKLQKLLVTIRKATFLILKQVWQQIVKVVKKHCGIRCSIYWFWKDLSSGAVIQDWRCQIIQTWAATNFFRATLIPWAGNKNSSSNRTDFGGYFGASIRFQNCDSTKKMVAHKCASIIVITTIKPKTTPTFFHALISFGHFYQRLDASLRSTCSKDITKSSLTEMTGIKCYYWLTEAYTFAVLCPTASTLRSQHFSVL